MTAYLQPGDKIHISVPWSPQDRQSDHLQKSLEEAYKEHGIEVVITSGSDSDLPIQVVSVIRSAEGCSHLDLAQ